MCLPVRRKRFAERVAFIELHARSAFSFLRGASHPEDLVAAAAEAGLPALALTDRNGVYGSVRAHQAAREVGLRALVGAELTLEDGSALPVLVRNRTGYENLCRLLTRAHLRAAKGEMRVCWNELPEFSEGLVALSGDSEGPLQRAWEANGKDGLEAAWGKFSRAFAADARSITLQRHLVRGESRINRPLMDLAEKTGTPLVASNAVTYARAPGRRVQDVFTCLRHHTHLDAAGRLLASNAERYVKGEAAISELFRDLPEALENTVRIADSLEFSMQDLGYRFPDYPAPSGESQDAYLSRMAWHGARERYGALTPQITRQLERELALIYQLGFSGYFLIVWDIVNYCRESRIMVQGRGSAANSVVCYVLGITAADPIKYNLLFERFLSEGRTSWPDIDLDLPSGDRREQVIQEVYRRYGERGAAMTANVITYRGRSAVREIGKALNFPEDIINRFSDLFAHGDFPHTLELSEHMRQAGIAPDNPRAATLMALYRQIHGLPRHLGQHSGGMIICQGRLDTVMPLENASMPGRVVAQWDKDDCADMGIIKVDLLGLGMMSVLQDTFEMAQARGHRIDLTSLPQNDPKTFELLNAADTIGVFQVESRAQMATLPRLKPKEFYDLVVEVAIVRPGPIVGDLAHPYLERRNGRQPIDWIHPELRPVLERTLGVPLFQEQVLKMAMVLADFSGAEAEELRRAMSFHRSEERMRRVQLKLRAALTTRGHTPEVIEKVVGAISSFALYGFPESHSISFALLAYASAYLKVHYPAEFYAGLLNNQPMGFYAPATLIQDAKRRGLRFFPPCVVLSGEDSMVLDDTTIRLGLRMLKGVRRASIRQMLESRAHRSFTDLADFRRRTRFDLDERRVLAAGGALQAFSEHRREALWRMQDHWEADGLFTDSGTWSTDATTPPPAAVTPLPRMTYAERIHADYLHTGATTGRHPMAVLRPRLPHHYRRAIDLQQLPSGQTATVAGAVICRQRPGTAKGVVFISLEDETGIANVIVYPKLFEKFRLTIIQEPFLRVLGRLQHQDGVTHLKAWKIEPLIGEALPATASHDFH